MINPVRIEREEFERFLRWFDETVPFPWQINNETELVLDEETERTVRRLKYRRLHRTDAEGRAAEMLASADFCYPSKKQGIEDPRPKGSRWPSEYWLDNCRVEELWLQAFRAAPRVRDAVLDKLLALQPRLQAHTVDEMVQAVNQLLELLRGQDGRYNLLFDMVKDLQDARNKESKDAR